MLDNNAIIFTQKKYLNPVTQFIESHSKFINDIKKKYNKPDEKTKLQEYLRPIYLELLKSLFNIFNKNNSSRNEMLSLLRQAYVLKSFENFIVNSFFNNNTESKNPTDNRDEENLKRYQLLEQILLEYQRRKIHYSKHDYPQEAIEKLKRKLIHDCMKYIVHRINKRMKYIYKIKSKLNSINLKEDVKKRRGTERKLKFIQHLYSMIDKCCINLIHLTLKEALPVVHDVRTVIIKALSNDFSDNLPSLLLGTNDLSGLKTENIQDSSLLYTWFLVMFSMLRVKNAAEADEQRVPLTEHYLDAGNAKANEYGNKKTSLKFLQNRIRKLLGNLNNFKLKYEWERLKKNRLIHKVYKKKLLEDNEEYKTHFEAAIMNAIPRILKARVAVRGLFKLLGSTEVDAADPKYLEKMQQEKEEKEEETEKKKKEKKKKMAELEEVDIKDVIKDVYNESNDKVFDLYLCIDTILANMMAQTNRSVYLQRDVKVAMKKYITEARKSSGLAPFKPAARKKIMYNIQYNKNIPKDLRRIMKKQIKYLSRMSRQQKKFRRTFKRFRKCPSGEELTKFPPPTEVVYKKWEKRSYRRRLRKGYRKKVQFLPKFRFMFVEESDELRAKTRERKLAGEYIQQNVGKPEKGKEEKEYTSPKEMDKVENIYRRKKYKPKRKGPGVWTGKLYNEIRDEYDTRRRKIRDPWIIEKTPSECERSRLNNKWNFIGDVHNTNKAFVPKTRPDFKKYIKELLEGNKRYQFKKYIQRRKEHHVYCNGCDFRQKRHLECENQLPEEIPSGNVEAVKRKRLLRTIQDLINRKQLEDEIKNQDTSDEEFEEVKHILKRMKDAENWCNEHDSSCNQKWSTNT